MEIKQSPHWNQEKKPEFHKFSAKKKPIKKFKIFLALFASVMLLAGGLISVYMTQINQDIRQQASEGNYGETTIASGNQEPGNAEFGWNYNTGKPATDEDWTKIYDENGKVIEIAGTYVHCQSGECKRYVVNLPDTHRALEEYSAAHQQENAVCIKEMQGACVAWKKAEPTEKPPVVTTVTKTPSPKVSPSTQVAKQCHPNGELCPNNGLCTTTPYGYYCQDLAEVSTNGTKACDHNLLIEYNNGEWHNVSGCENGCRNGSCNPPPTASPTPESTLKKPGESCNPFLKECSTGCSLTWSGFQCSAEPTPKPNTTPSPATSPTPEPTETPKKPGESCRPLFGDCETVCSLTSSGFKCAAEPTPTAGTTPPPATSPTPEPTKTPKKPGESCRPLFGDCETICSLTSSGFKCAAEPTPTPGTPSPATSPTPEPTQTLKKPGESCTPLFGQCETICSLTESGFKCAPVNTPTPLPTAIPTPVPTLVPLNLPDWNEACKQTCQPGLKCSNGKCLDDCPSDPSGSCNNSGLICEEGGNILTYGNLYVCSDNNTWQQKGETKIQFDVWCSDHDKSVYRQSFEGVRPELLQSGNIQINCNVTLGESEEGVCGEYFSLNDQIYMVCQKDGCNCPDTLAHEIGHQIADQISEQENGNHSEIRSFNETIGCSYNGKGEYQFTNESPVSDYGRTNCAEAFGEFVEYYNNPDIGPCWFKQNGLNKQLEWAETSPDSPFKGDQNQC